MAALRLLVALATAVLLVTGSSDTQPPKPQRYISLGDSLAAGMQPDSRGVDRPTHQGYADVLAQRLHLSLTRLSCGGATTTTLLSGGAHCQPAHEASQLVRAERQLKAYPDTALVTIDIGDNDVEACMDTEPPAIDVGCVHKGRVTIARNLPQIAQRLRAAAGPKTRIVGLVDYNQFLSLWLDGSAGRAAARRSLRIIGSLNALMERIYHENGIETADAGDLFHTEDLHTRVHLAGYGGVPLGVERICRWTWACSSPPIGHDDHANASGYRVIADAIAKVLAHSS
jgi:lysophospholipase L1-like esterase